MHLHRLHRLLAAALLLAALLLPDITAHAAARTRGVSAVRNTVNNNRRTQAARQGGNLQDGGADVLANIDEDWYLEITPAYVKAGRTPIDTYYGATFSLGYMFSLENRLQIDIGCYTSGQFNGSITYLRAFTYDRKAPGDIDDNREVAHLGSMRIDAQTQAKAIQVPMLLTYSYNIRLDARERLELRLTASSGVVAMFDTWKVKGKGSFYDPAGYSIRDPYSAAGVYTSDADAPGAWGGMVAASESFSGHDSNMYLFAFGGGFGLTWHFTNRCYIDGGYRFLWMDTAANGFNAKTGTLWNGCSAWNGMNTHTYSLTLGWKF